MAKYAVIRIKGHQYKVSEKDEILVDYLKGEKSVAEVLLVADGEKVTVGKPLVKSVSVKLKVLGEMEKGQKIEVFKYKAKSRYRKHTGFRPKYSRLLVEKIS